VTRQGGAMYVDPVAEAKRVAQAEKEAAAEAKGNG